MLSYLLVAGLTAVIACARAQSFGQAEVVYKWNLVDLEWSSEAEKIEAIRNGSFVPERNLLVGLKVHKDDVYVTVPRWFFPSGVPVTLAKVVQVNNTAVLRPYPSWAYQNQSLCDSFQFVMSMEIDPNTNFMYVIDTGRVGGTLNLCPAKLYVFDLNTDKLIDKYEFPDEVVNRTKNFLNDIVLDYVEGKVQFAYMSDVFDNRLIIFDITKKHSYFLKHPSMEIVEEESVLTINNRSYTDIRTGVNGIAMSPDFRYLYYCSISSYSLYQIPTSTLRNVSRGTEGIRRVGTKVSQSGGITHGTRYLYFGALSLNSVYYWNSTEDAANQNVAVSQANMTRQGQKLLVNDNLSLQFPDTFSFDNKGYLWFTSDRLPEFWNKGIPKSSLTDEAFMRIWKVYVGENEYLYQADMRTKSQNIFTMPTTFQNNSTVRTNSQNNFAFAISGSFHVFVSSLISSFFVFSIITRL